ncbi:hypothetical protein M9434_002367 [Picochlorum sp. BPE23]|nr:hypothetical protein M9435_006627 [Picochlorum sp. BPE23]KAI8114241.1 hypothetical protein M9434_002367 [Picochlorum sp. BPE23]WPT18008.1 V-type proton ATPase subunit e2 [Picochlorum sp. SENEW3]|mmetsp:Transcript_4988/g.9898  ORF Transcript_4988/g.9898 Transcript_4988/m.9898 type:complete len:80 (-) Transcript_4988:2280-2519(-)|eukprot:jgi/Picre1/31975/NNA_007323.t1
MGFWLGSLIFACLEVVGFLGVEGILGKQYRRERLDNRFNNKNTLLPQLLVGTAVFCCWMMWAIVYIGQMYPLVNPVLSG